MVLTRRQVVRKSAALAGGVVLAALVALVLGSVTMTPGEIWTAITNPHSTLGVILFDVRLPRVLLAVVVGAALSLAGACYQALLRNPLAEPYVLGISSGAALGVIMSLVLVPRWSAGTPLAGLLGALLTTAAVYLLGYRRGRISGQSLLLAGIIVASFLSAVIVFLMTALGTRDLRSTAFWLMGDLGLFPGIPLPWLVLPVIGAGALAYRFAPELNLLLVGEEEAAALGVDVPRAKLVVYVAASALTAVAVAAAGSIGFVGLLVPHIVRMLFGNDYRVLLPTAALAGAIILVAADTAARTVVAPTELPVGAFTALAGAPLFIYLLRRRSPE
jgi:iron complex transport system permease protein